MLSPTAWRARDGKSRVRQILVRKSEELTFGLQERGESCWLRQRGYPSTTYRDPLRADEKKPTNPTNQGQKWYSHALLKVLQLQTAYPQAKVALAFPDFPRYEALFRETKPGLEKLGIAVLMVNSSGEVREWGLD